MHISVKKIAYLGVLIGLSVLFNIYTIVTGASNIAISFTYIPTFIAGYFLGPLSGALVGFLGDLLGCFIAPKGAIIPLILVSSALMGIVPGLIRIVVHYFFPKQIENPKLVYIVIFANYLLLLFLVTAGLNTFALWITYAKAKKTFWVYLSVRLPYQTAVALLNGVISAAIYPVMLKVFRGTLPEFCFLKKTELAKDITENEAKNKLSKTSNVITENQK